MSSKFLSGWSGWMFAVVTVFLFRILSKFFTELIPIPRGIVRGYGDEYRLFRWRNLIISFIHAVITGTAALVCVVLYGDRMREDMVAFVNWPTYGLCCFTTGYFLYDAIDIIVAKRIIEKWDILLHHMTILISASYVVTYAECVGYQAFGMLVELNTIFLHRRQLFQLAGIEKNDPNVRMNMYINLFTFVVFRCFPLAYLTVGIFYDGHRVPRWYLCFYGTCMALLNVINAILLYRLIRADFLHTNGHNGNGKNHVAGHKKAASTVGCCEGLNVTGSGYVRPNLESNFLKSGEAKENSNGTLANRELINRSHFNSNVLKDVTQKECVGHLSSSP